MVEEVSSSSEKTAEIERGELKTNLNLIFNLPEFIDLKAFKDELKKNNLENIEVYEKKELEGLISVPIAQLNIRSAVQEAQKIIAKPIKNTIVKSGFQSKIKEEIKEKSSTKSFIKWVQLTHKEFKANKITKEQVKKKVEERFSELFGKQGVNTIVNLFSQDKEHILNSWAKLEDFFIQKLALDFYIFQQIREASFIIVVIRSNKEKIKSKILNSDKLIIPITEDVEFYRREIQLPYGKTINNIFTHNRLSKVLMTFNPSKSTYSFIQKLMRLRKTNTDLNFMTFMIEKQNDILSEKLKDFEFDAEYIKNQAIDLDPKLLSSTIETLKHLIDTVYFGYEDYVKPSKRMADKITRRKKLISDKEYKKIFQNPVTVDNLKSLMRPQEWMLELIPEYNIEKTEKLLKENEDMHLSLLKLLRELRNDLVNYKKAKEEENRNKIDYYGKNILKILWELAKLKIRLP